MRGRLCFLAAWLCFLPHFSNAQKGDDLREQLKNAQILAADNLDSALAIAQKVFGEATALDSQRVAFTALRARGLFYEDRSKYDLAIAEYRRAMALADARLPLHDRLNVYNDWAIIHKKVGDFSTARAFHQRAIDLGAAAGDWEMVENGHHGLATMYSQMSDFDQSAKHYFASIEAAEKRGNKPGIVLSQQNLANIYTKARNYAMARQNILAAHRMAIELGDSARLGTVLKIWGNLHLAQGQLDSAEQKQRAALAIFQKKGKRAQEAESWLSLADIFRQQKRLPEAEAALQNCAVLSDLLAPYSRAVFYQTFGKLDLELGRPGAAIAQFQKSLDATEKLGLKEIARENHLQLADLLQKQGDFRAALDHSAQANRLSEAIFEADKQKSMAEANFKFDVERLDFQIASQQKELRQARNIRLAQAVFMALLLALLVFAWSQARQKQRALARSELLMKELHHRVKNNLQTITSMMRVQARQVSDPALLAVLNENRARLETIGALHQQLYSGANLKTVDFQVFVQGLTEKIDFAHGRAGTAIRREITVEPRQIDVDMAMPLGLIVNELLTNSFKHAFRDHPQPTVRISLVGQRFSYSDNGSGFPPGFSPTEAAGFGFQLIVNLAHQLKMDYRLFNQSGAHFEMFPR